MSGGDWLKSKTVCLWKTARDSSQSALSIGCPVIAFRDEHAEGPARRSCRDSRAFLKRKLSPRQAVYGTCFEYRSVASSIGRWPPTWPSIRARCFAAAAAGCGNRRIQVLRLPLVALRALRTRVAGATVNFAAAVDLRPLPPHFRIEDVVRLWCCAREGRAHVCVPAGAAPKTARAGIRELGFGFVVIPGHAPFTIIVAEDIHKRGTPARRRCLRRGGSKADPRVDAYGEVTKPTRDWLARASAAVDIHRALKIQRDPSRSARDPADGEPGIAAQIQSCPRRATSTARSVARRGRRRSAAASNHNGRHSSRRRTPHGAYVTRRAERRIVALEHADRPDRYINGV